MSDTPAPRAHTDPPAPPVSLGRRPQPQQADSVSHRSRERMLQRPHLRALRGGRPPVATPHPRLLVGLIEPGRFTQVGWTAELHVTGIPALQTDHGPSIHVNFYPELSDLFDELDGIASALRRWWPNLIIRISLRGSTAAARETAGLHGLELPR